MPSMSTKETRKGACGKKVRSLPLEEKDDSILPGDKNSKNERYATLSFLASGRQRNVARIVLCGQLQRS
jgi:hypothetical protein